MFLTRQIKEKPDDAPRLLAKQAERIRSNMDLSVVILTQEL